MRSRQQEPMKSRRISTVADNGRHRTELHEQQEGNRNYVFVRFSEHLHGPRAGETSRCDMTGFVYTVFTKDDSCGRGEYAEEIDVATAQRSPAAAKKVAQAAIDAEYDGGLRVSRVVERYGMWM